MDSFVAGIATFVPLLVIARAAHFYLETKVFDADNGTGDRAQERDNTPILDIEQEKNTLGLSSSLDRKESTATSIQISGELFICQMSSSSTSAPPSVVQSTASSLSNLTDSFKKRKFNLSSRLEGYLNGESNL